MQNTKTLRVIQANTEYTFLVKLAWQGNDKFIIPQADLPKALKSMDISKGIEYIKVFDLDKNRFKAVSKAFILKLYDWETENIEILQSIPYFK